MCIHIKCGGMYMLQIECYSEGKPEQIESENAHQLDSKCAVWHQLIWV